MEHFSVVGFVEALWKLPAHLRLLGRVRLALRARRYDLVILVDYPGYHLRVAAEAAAAGIPVLYYIAPQMWAWAPGRVRRLAAVRRSEEHTSELQSRRDLVCRLLLEKKKDKRSE